jgi:hypothetical protein
MENTILQIAVTVLIALVAMYAIDYHRSRPVKYKLKGIPRPTRHGVQLDYEPEDQKWYLSDNGRRIPKLSFDDIHEAIKYIECNR